MIMGVLAFVLPNCGQVNFHTLLRHGEAPGLTVARLDSVGGARHPEKMLQPTVPFYPVAR